MFDKNLSINIKIINCIFINNKIYLKIKVILPDIIMFLFHLIYFFYSTWKIIGYDGFCVRLETVDGRDGLILDNGFPEIYKLSKNHIVKMSCRYFLNVKNYCIWLICVIWRVVQGLIQFQSTVSRRSTNYLLVIFR